MPRALRSAILSLSIALALASAPVTSGCGGAVTSSRTLVDRSVDDATFSEVRRRYLELAPDDAMREPLRGRLLAHLASQSEAVLRTSDYDEVVAHLAQMSSLLAPVDFGADRALPQELRPLAEHVATHGAQRGDEPRVLAAELILAALDAENADAHRTEYERVSSWGREARAPVGQDVISLVEGGVGLIHVWEEHARLTPSPAVLGRLAGLYLGLRDAISGTTTAEGFRPPRSFGDMEHLEMAAVVMQRAPLEAAAVFLTHGDVATASEQLAGSRDRRGDSWRLRAALEDAGGDGSEGAQALYEIASGFAEGRPEVSLGLCRVGLRRFPTDPRFPLCLARVSSSMAAIGDTADYYVQAIERAPAQQSLYDESLEALATMISRGAFARARDIGEVRTAGEAAHRIVAERAARFADAEPGPLDQPTLHLALARAELATGHAEQARANFDQALTEARRLPELPDAALEARQELAELELRLGAPERARVLFTEALSLVSQGQSGDRMRARLESGVGDAYRISGEQASARESYRRALTLLDGLDEARGPEAEARREVERGIALRRLGELDRSREAFAHAIALAPQPEVAADILQHLVTDAPDAELADEVFRRARVGSPIGHSWKVYLALWVEAVRVLAEQPESEDGARVLDAESARSGWYARLASLARGELPSSEILASAEGGSERCEAHFYGAIRSLRAGDRAGARRGLESSVETGMVGRDEFGMAQELLRSLD